MLNKRSFGSRVYFIAKQNGLEQTAVNRIINSYISICREDLLNGIEVNFFGLVTLVPNVRLSNFKATTAYYTKKCAEQTGYPYYSVHHVIKEYYESLKEDLFNGKSVDLRTIVTLHPLSRDGQLVKIHSAISTSIKNDLEFKDSCVTSIRAHTSKILKSSIPCKKEARNQ